MKKWRPLCKFDGCDNRSAKSCKGWCQKHHTRWFRHGDPSIVVVPHRPRKDAAAVLAARIVVDGVSGCHVWQGARLPNGYGVFGIQGHSRYVHRAAWEIANGPMPDGHELHHVCLTRACCNPEHLRPVTRKEHRAAHREMRATA